MKLKTNRVASFLIILLIYAVASAIGLLIYFNLPYHFALSLLIADVISTFFVFIFSVILKNASVYDPYWSVQPPVIVITAFLSAKVTPLGILLLIAILFWGIRLTLNWGYTFKDLTHQDWRYTMLKEKTGKFYPLINLIGIHLVPTLVVYFCTLSAVYSIKYEAQINPFSVIFILVSFFAATLQCIADIEMHRFRKHKTEAFIRDGLWKYSRHPNYLGEILMWWGIGLASFSAMPNAPYLLIGAILNTLLFIFVSIPMADKRQSRKIGYEDYKSQTRVILPIYKKQK